jgi:hypothetical protein
MQSISHNRIIVRVGGAPAMHATPRPPP